MLNSAREQEKREGEMASLVVCAESLMRDVVVVRAFKAAYPTDGARRVKRLREGDTPTDDELDIRWPCFPSPCRAQTILKKPYFVKSHMIPHRSTVALNNKARLHWRETHRPLPS